MSINDQIKENLKQAMRDKNEIKLSVLRMLTGAIRNKEISLRETGAEVELSDEQVQDVIKSEVKKRNDAISSYESGGRADLAAKEKEEAGILEEYLPPQLSEEEIEKEVRELIAGLGEVGSSDFGKVMGQAMAKLKGRADGNKVTAAVKKCLNH